MEDILSDPNCEGGQVWFLHPEMEAKDMYASWKVCCEQWPIVEVWRGVNSLVCREFRVVWKGGMKSKVQRDFRARL